MAELTSVMVDTKGTAVKNSDFDEIVHDNFRLTPDTIIKTFDLRHSI